MVTLNKSISSIVLIGMPGPGKSTIGVLIADDLGLDFVDTDKSIELECGKPIQELLDQSDYQAVRAVEEAVLLKEQAQKKVVSTGGSAVYSSAGMAHLTANAVTVFLDVDINELTRRIKDFNTRGIVRKPGQSLTELFAERRELYLRYADIRIDCSGHDIEECLQQVITATRPYIS